VTETEVPKGSLEIAGPIPVPPAPVRPSYGRTAYAMTPPPAGDFTWLRLNARGEATAFAGKVEYGQAIRSGLAVEVADELRLPLAAVEVVLGDTGRVPWDMGTFGSQSTARVGLQLRKAAASARQALLELAADRLDLPVGDLEASEGCVVSRTDRDRSIAYGDLLAGNDLLRPVDDSVELTPAADFTVMGQTQPRIDAIARVTGQAVYSQDVMVSGMLFAKVIRPPSFGAVLETFDGTVAEQMPGVVAVVRDGELAAVLAESDEAGELAARVVRAQWRERPEHAGRWDIPRLLAEGAESPILMQQAGSLEEGFAAAGQILEATYYAPYIQTAPMEPRAAVARWDRELLTVWAGTQRPFGIRTELAQLFAMSEDAIRVIAPEIGGGFGGKSIYTPALEAARLARIAGRPVRVAYTRAEEMTWTTFRPAALIQIKSGFNDDGRVVAWSYRAMFADKNRPMIGLRGSETPYDIPNVTVEVAAAEGPLTAGSFRSLGGAVNHFAREIHMDEIAAAVGLDPVELRLRNLTHPRFRRVLETAARRFGWSPGKAPSGRGFGVALGEDVGSYAATAVEVTVHGSEVRVRRVAAAMDCGLTVNPAAAVNQVEGSVVMGIGTALYEAIDVEGGRVLNPGFTRYRVPRIGDTPTIAVDLVGDPGVPSTGAGEPAIVPVAAAISNALFDLRGERHRELPFQRFLR
jgi:isoquinoline 1-oxidoreductase